LGAFLDDIFDNNKYLKKGYIKEILGKLEAESREEHLKDIDTLKKRIK
jgi:methyl coenzyme M reductase alpha subunit